MWLLIGPLSTTQVTVGLAGAYLASGVAVASSLGRRGLARATVLSALVAWPLLLPLLEGERPVGEARPGPLAGRIDAAFLALRDTLGDPAAADLPWSEDLDDLWTSLRHADERIGLVDRLLSEEPFPSDTTLKPSLDALGRARAHALEELEHVLHEVAQLRLQVGLLALAGDVGPVRQRLQELSARAGALDELAQLDAGGSRPDGNVPRGTAVE